MGSQVHSLSSFKPSQVRVERAQEPLHVVQLVLGGEVGTGHAAGIAVGAVLPEGGKGGWKRVTGRTGNELMK